MNFKFTEDEQKTIDMIHEFGVNVAGPGAAEIDAQERFPSENVEKLGGVTKQLKLELDYAKMIVNKQEDLTWLR